MSDDVIGHEGTPSKQDLYALNVSEHGEMPRTLHVVHPVSGEPIGIEMDIISGDSHTARELHRRGQRARIKNAPSKRLDPEDIELQGVRVLAALIKAWRGVEWKGAALPYSFENAVMLLTELVWLRKQVDEFAHETSNFLAGN